MSRVEVFATGIKIESKPFSGADQGIEVTFDPLSYFELQECMAAI